jgi:hypothetical protein
MKSGGKNEKKSCHLHHEKREENFFCEDCYVVICRPCLISHSRHEILPIEYYSEKQRTKIRSLNESLVIEEKELKEYIERGENQIKLIQEDLEKKSIKLKEIQFRLDSIEKFSLISSDDDLIDQSRYQNLLDLVHIKFLLKLPGIMLSQFIISVLLFLYF